MFLRLNLFAMCGAMFVRFLFLARQDGSAQISLKRASLFFLREPSFCLLAIWFVWACIAWILALREGYVSITFNGIFLFDLLYSAHNQLLAVWFGQGTPALLLFLAFLAVLARHCVRVSLYPEETEKGSWTLGLIVLVLLVNSMIEVILLDHMLVHGCLFFWASGAVFGMRPTLPECVGRLK